MQDLVLASRSPTRLRLLQNAGLTCIVRPAYVDEDAFKAALRSDNASADDATLTLAEAKARKIDAPGALIIAADQMLEIDGVWFDKPADLHAARRQLQILSGRTHHLVVGAVIFQNGGEIWRIVTHAALTMRDLPDDEIQMYLACVGKNALHSVGGYEIEGRGVRLFSHIQGDLFTIQGLPLLEISGFLHDRGIGLGAP